MRAVAFQAAFMIAAGVAGRMGSAQLAAHQIGLQLWEFVALLLDSFAIAAQSLVGAALGGGDVTAARQHRLAGQPVRRLGPAWCSRALLAAGWFVIPALFSSDSGVQHQAHVLWPWLVGMMPAAGIVFALDGVLLGAGDNAFIRTVTLVAALRRLHPAVPAHPAAGLGADRGVGRAGGFIVAAAGRHGLAHPVRPVAGGRGAALSTASRPATCS